jgi:signal-transduction protein with cAMP-binding, CBS, and nucleotidyltransferase domain
VSRVADILRHKGSVVIGIDHTSSALDAVRAMVEANVGALLVRADDDVVGIVTERDYLRRIALMGRSLENTGVSEIMSAPVVCVTPDTTIDECMSIMTQERIRHLPVMESGSLAGVVSIGDVVKFQSQQQSVQLRYLTEYIGAS